MLIKVTQILTGLLALILFGFAGLYLFNPLGASELNGMIPNDAYGITNMRVNAAALASFGVMAAIGAVKKDFVFVAPAALYFLFVILIRLLGLALDGGHSDTIRGLVLAIVLFIIAEIGVQVFKKNKAK